MMSYLVYLYIAIIGPWFGLAQLDSPIVSASLIGRDQIDAGKLKLARAQASDSAEKVSCRKFVGEFYAWYVAHDKNGDPLRAALQRWKSSFSPELIRTLNEDREAAAKSPNEIIGLDFDPVLNSQDPAAKYVPGKVTQNGRRFLVDVFSVYAGKRSAVPAVVPELRHERGQWVIANIIYKADGKTDDLLNILRRLKADRNKGSKSR